MPPIEAVENSEYDDLAPGKNIQEEETNAEDRGDFVPDESDVNSDDDSDDTVDVTNDDADDTEEPEVEESAEESDVSDEVEDSDDDAEESEEEDDVEEAQDVEGEKESNLHKALKFEREKRRELQNQFKDLQAALEQNAQQPAPEQEPEKPLIAEDELNSMWDAALDGDNSKASKMMMDMMQRVQQDSIQKAAKQSEGVTDQTLTRKQMEADLQTKAVELVGVFDQLNPDSVDYDEGFESRVMARRDNLIRTGETFADALEDAVYIEARRAGYQPLVQEEVAAPAPKKKKPNVKKKMETAAKQPARLQGDSDVNRDKIDIMKLSDDDFEKMSDEELAKARGDMM